MFDISLAYRTPALWLGEMRTRSPPLNFLRAFEAVARNRSFTRAADELCVTQAAVSQQVRSLEKSLGAELFNRTHRQPTLTHAGEILLPAVCGALDRIASATEEIHALHKNRQVRLNLSRFFLSHWLAPRLDDFVRSHSELDLSLQHFYQSLTPEAFARDEVDLAIVWGQGSWPGLTSALLFRLELTPICSPSILRKTAKAQAQQDIRRHTLLRSYHDWWTDWAQHTRLELNHQATEYIADYDALIQAALDGRGVALLPISLCVEHLKRGHLVRVSDTTIPTQEGYYVVGPAEALRRPVVSNFRDWLVTSASSERGKTESLPAQPSLARRPTTKTSAGHSL